MNIEVQRAVVFTDYECREDARPEVMLSKNDGRTYARVTIARGANFETAIEYEQVEMLRSLAACLLAAADEWEVSAAGEVEVLNAKITGPL